MSGGWLAEHLGLSTNRLRHELADGSTRTTGHPHRTGSSRGRACGLSTRALMDDLTRLRRELLDRFDVRDFTDWPPASLRALIATYDPWIDMTASPPQPVSPGGPRLRLVRLTTNPSARAAPIGNGGDSSVCAGEKQCRPP